MATEDIKDWNQIAQRYNELVSPNHFINRQLQPVLWECLGDIRGRPVLDLGCGPGWFSQLMHEAGAQVIGVDGSGELLKAARASYPHIQFIEHDLLEGLPPLGDAFDRIVANMVLMDIPNLTRLMSAVREVLEPQGKFIFTMPHPCFFNLKSHRDEEGRLYKKVTGYLQPEVWLIEGFGGHNHYHRSLTFYFDHLRANRLAVTRLYEPKPQSDTPRTGTDAAYYESISTFILIEATAI
ncbi:MAG: class I SAM-dependent methyltransferase [Abitibacteriaceae bacterium]|nr:class I SAM-dependent methyltransferase [Abditibacteriaceae bacterium]MBV9868216.1 class I SAM-dependent methyltransferase [Abditibacteriaceae bacterium]